jgi:hypothetical protein
LTWNACHLVSDRYVHRHSPIVSQSTKRTNCAIVQTSSTDISRPTIVPIDRTFAHEQGRSSSATQREAHTWTRLSETPATRTVLSPIHIPTFSRCSSGPSQDCDPPISLNSNYDDDEFERYSPTPPSTPKYRTHEQQNSSHLQSKYTIDAQPTLVNGNHSNRSTCE